ncbi:hypothetical protein [Sphingomonas sp.]|uniref:hypothetical protein n=1 Tax=Sphingomonas sp. TaxID=28214 RepID=UPI000DB5A071|nr:hypothetical protein [Sphingomonas sp.]PZU09210.1 MAG: hypothetical protein DI605_10635 [Sphingomonas sp.]
MAASSIIPVPNSPPAADLIAIKARARSRAHEGSRPLEDDGEHDMTSIGDAIFYTAIAGAALFMAILGFVSIEQVLRERRPHR